MNTIFIDFKNINNLKKSDKIKNTIFKYCIKDDILDGILNKNTVITIDKEYIFNQLRKNKYSIHDRLLKAKIKNKYRKNNEVNILFSKEFDAYLNVKKYILNLLRLNSITIYNEINIKNNLKTNDMLYINKHIADSKINIIKLKILVAINNINDFDQDKLLEYISKYKFVDILRTESINKYDCKKLFNIIENINNEYGTTIDIIKRRNLQKYHICLSYSDMNKLDFSQKYILSNKVLYINMKDIDSDIFCDEYLCYKRYEPEILTLFNRLELDSQRFSKVKLGFIFK